MEAALKDAKALFRRAAEYFGEDGDAATAAKATEPERFFSKLQAFLIALKKAREDRQRVEHCLAADGPAAKGSAPTPRAGESKEAPGTPGPPPPLKMRSAPEPRGEDSKP